MKAKGERFYSMKQKTKLVQILTYIHRIPTKLSMQ